MTAHLETSEELAALGTPDIRVSARQTFNIDCEMQVPAFSNRTEHVPVGSEECLPGGLLLAFRCWLDPMSFQDVADGRIRDRVSQVGQSALDAIVAPGWALSRAIRSTRSTSSWEVGGRPIFARLWL